MGTFVGLWGSRGGRIAVLIVAVALGIRLTAAVLSFDHAIDTDPRDFDRHARSIASGHEYPVSGHGYPNAVKDYATAVRPPAFPLLLAATYRVQGGVDAPPGPERYFAPDFEPDQRHVNAGRLVQAGIGAAIVALVGLIAFQLWGRRIALVALAIAALYPPLIVLNTTLYSEPLFVAFELAAVAAALRARVPEARTLRWAALAGALAGLAWLTRSNGFFLLVPLVVLVWTGRPWHARRSLAAPAVMAAVALLTISPWMVRNSLVMDTFVPGTSDEAGYTAAGTYNDTARDFPLYRAGWQPPDVHPPYRRIIEEADTEVEFENELLAEARGHAVDNPAYVLKVGYCNTLRWLHAGTLSCGDPRALPRDAYVREFGVSRNVAYLTVLSFSLVLVMAVAGAFTKTARNAPGALWLIPLALSITVFIISGVRFRSPIDPFLILLAAVAATVSWDRWRARRGAVSA